MLQLDLYKQKSIEKQNKTKNLLLIPLFMLLQHVEILITQLMSIHRWELFSPWIRAQTYHSVMQSKEILSTEFQKLSVRDGANNLDFSQCKEIRLLHFGLGCLV